MSQVSHQPLPVLNERPYVGDDLWGPEVPSPWSLEPGAQGVSPSWAVWCPPMVAGLWLWHIGGWGWLLAWLGACPWLLGYIGGQDSQWSISTDTSRLQGEFQNGAHQYHC